MTALTQSKAERVYLKDYRPPEFLVDTVELRFELDETLTTIKSSLHIQRNPDAGMENAPLVLFGRKLTLMSVVIDGDLSTAADYSVDDEALTIPKVPDRFDISIETQIKPADNKSGTGMFVAHGIIATQCEAEGFREMTYFPDRPDVLSRYSVTLVANKKTYPILLSNGNPVERGELDGNLHWVRWEDPFPKPSYIFAIVAGDLGHIEDSYTTQSGRKVELGIYTNHQNIDKCDYAMSALKRSMKWDEDTYGLECDVDVYNVVGLLGTMNAMENKGLNLFNADGIVADPNTTTDNDYMVIERIIGHEYFHNWTGNRITCRDWFQLNLKEGLTRFRDQEFSRAMSAPAVKRIQHVRNFRNDQFAEDAGPGAHAVQPPSYIEIRNFYTPTVYDKGAELIRMIYILLGEEAYFKGIALYVERHDGRAVTIEDFVRAMEEGGDVDLTQFRLWYLQSGTPQLVIEQSYDSDSRSCTLEISQSCPPTPGQSTKKPFHIPVAVGLLDADGHDLPLTLENENVAAGAGTRVLELKEERQSFTFHGVDARPVVSVLRDFSAPVQVEINRSPAELAFLMSHDSDPFCRWEAAQRYSTDIILSLIEAERSGQSRSLSVDYVAASRSLLCDEQLDKGLIAHLLTLPDEPALGDAMDVIDIDAIHRARSFVQAEVGSALRELFLEHYSALQSDEPYRPDARSISRRALRNLSLQYLMILEESEFIDLCMQQLKRGDNMTDVLAALTLMANTDCDARPEALDFFYKKWRHDEIVLNKWFFAQATSKLDGTVERVRELMQHPDFDIMDQGKGAALLGGFLRRNYIQFHHPSGNGYRLLSEVVIKVDSFNPDYCWWLMPQIMRWRRYEPARSDLMRAELEKMAATPGISKGLIETVSNALGAESTA